MALTSIVAILSPKLLQRIWLMFDKPAQRVLALPRPAKRVIALLFDACLCIITVWIAFCFRFNDWYLMTGVQFWTIPVSLVIALPLFITFGLYRAIFRFMGWAAFSTVIKCVLIYGAVYMVIFTVISVPAIPRTVGILQPMLLLLAVGLSRFVARYFLYDAYSEILGEAAPIRTLVYGAGSQGRQLVSALGHSAEFKVVGFLDDDKGLKGMSLNGVKIYSPLNIEKVCADLEVKTVRYIFWLFRRSIVPDATRSSNACVLLGSPSVPSRISAQLRLARRS